MSSTKKLEDITLGQQNCKILGRLTRLWSSRNMRSNSANSLINIDGIIIDKNGEMVQITVPKKLQKQFQPLLAQGHGSVHLFTNLSAIDTKQRTHIYHHKTTCSSSSPPQRSIVLTHEEITSPALHSNSAHMISCHQRHYIEATSSEQTEEVRLWGEHGAAFDEADVIEKSKQGIVVAIFVGLTAGSFKGVTQASSSSATQIFIDLDIPDITNFRESYKWEAPPLQQHVPQVLQLSPIQAAGQIYKLNQITELPTSSFQGGATYSCIAKISAIVPSTNWYYKVCRSCKVGYDSISEDPRCDCPAPKPMPMYKLPITITDDTGSINTIAFSFIAEDLVERSAYHASQNMKIGATEPAVAFEKAIGKTRLFHIGMGTNSSSSFAIKYVIRKSFPIDNPSSPLKATPIMPALPSPPQNTGSESSKAKRSLEFKEDTKCSEEQQQTTSDTLPKRQKPKLADDNTTEDTTKSSQNNLPNNKI